MAEAPPRLIVDGMNVVGSLPDGWWRDRRGAMARLAESLRRLDEDVCVVFDGRRWAGAPEDGAGLSVRWAAVADDEIARLVEAHPAPASVRVVTSDRVLAGRTRAAGAEVLPAGAFRRSLS